jgi:ABC-type uncharacterized transport system auxiliary subunit
MSKLAAILALVFVLVGCGDTSGPCDDYDPVGICRGSHSQTYSGT